MIVNTIRHSKEKIKNEVLGGIYNNGADLLDFSSKKEEHQHCRLNRYNNWKDAFGCLLSSDGIFYGMDSDIVILDNNGLLKLGNIISSTIDMVCVYLSENRKKSHGLWAIKSDILEKERKYFEYSSDKVCPLCVFFENLKIKQYTVLYTNKIKIKEINR